MSDFIQIDSKHDLAKEPMDLIKGLISRISFCNRPTVFSKSCHQHYFSRKVSQKIHFETSDAFKIYDTSILEGYNKLKPKLRDFSRNKNSKIDSMFDKQQCEKPVFQPIQQKKRISLRFTAPHRQIMIDRKYDKELSMKAAILAELQAIEKIKQNQIKCRSENHSPLAVQVYLKCNKKSRIETKKEMHGGNKINPMLSKTQGISLHKKRKKINHIIFK